MDAMLLRGAVTQLAKGKPMANWGLLVARMVLAILVSLAMFGCSNAQDVTRISQLALSPDGDMLVFRYALSRDEGYLVHYDVATGKTGIYDQPDDEAWCNPAFSPDGKWIAFSVYAIHGGAADPGKSKIEVMHPDGSGRHVVVDANGKEKSTSAFPPDGKTLLYGEGLTAASVGFTIGQVDLGTGEKTRETEQSFFQVGSFGFDGQGRVFYVAIAPSGPAKSQRTAPSQQLDSNNNLYVRGSPEGDQPYVAFATDPAAVVAYQQYQEIEQARYEPHAGQFYVVMRDSTLPEAAQSQHFVRDLYRLDAQKQLHRLTHENAVAFPGFDVSAGGNYLAYVAQAAPGEISIVINRMNLQTEKVEQFAVNVPTQGR